MFKVSWVKKLPCYPDIIAISETWLKTEILSSKFSPPDFNVFRRDRPDGHGRVLIACCH